jgi:GNAT superfamily N-acetyltransferase
MTTDFQLRPAELSDASACAQIILSSRSKYLPYAPLAHSPAEVLSWMQGELIPSGGVTVALLDGRVRGVIAISVEAGKAWINQLYVDPDHTGDRIGGRLLRKALQGLPRPVYLYTFQQNTSARRFYARYGFVEEAFSDGADNEEHCPDVMMRLDSTSAASVEISDDAQRMQVDAIHSYLTRSYWSPGISRERVIKAMQNSLCFGVFVAERGASERQIGFARVVTDRCTFAYLCDVYVLESHRGQGVSKRLLNHILAYPELQGLRRFLLATRDAHALYEQAGFAPIARPENMLERST